MYDAFDPKNARDIRGPERVERAPEPPMADREVPIGFSVTPPGVHEWLDGELAESDVRRAETARHVEFWTRLNADAAVRREVKTPAHVQAAIMAAIMPEKALALPTALPWYKRTLTITPTIAIAAAASLVAFGAMLALIARAR